MDCHISYRHQGNVLNSSPILLLIISCRPFGLELAGFEIPIEKFLLKLSKHEFSKLYFGMPVLEVYTDPDFQKTYKAVVSDPMDMKTVFQRLYTADPT